MEYNEKKIDIKENKLLQENKKLLSILLEDKTTKRNLIWATDNYKKYGERYKRNCPIHVLILFFKFVFLIFINNMIKHHADRRCHKIWIHRC